MNADARVLAAGLAVAFAAMVLTHPLAVLASLGLAVVVAARTGLGDRAPALAKTAFLLGLSITILNALFSWHGETVLWRAPFRLALLGRPALTAEALAWGAVAGLQLAATVVALGAATLAVPPEVLHRAMMWAGAPASLATAAGLAVRLAPDMARDASAMRRALRTRGVEPTGVAGAARVLVPLTARSLDRALLAEEALVVRGYDPAAKRRGPALPSVALVALAGSAMAVGVAVWGAGRVHYYPTISVPFGPEALAGLGLALAIPAVLVLSLTRRAGPVSAKREVKRLSS